MRMLILLLSILPASQAFSQLAGSGINGAGGTNTTRRMEVYSWASRPDEDGSDLQKKFIKQEWTTGIVYFKSGRPYMQVPLLFDVHNDMLYYKQGDVIMEFVDTVSQFSMLVPFKKDSLLMIFRRNFPEIQSNTTQTFYQILVEGKITLLKCMSKSILLFKDEYMPEEKKEDPEALYFAYLPGNKIVQVGFDAEKTIKNMSEYDWMIRDIMKKQKIKPKDEERLVELFFQLNQQFQ